MPATGYGEAEGEAGAPLLLQQADRAPLGALLLVVAILWLAAAIGGFVAGAPAIVGLGRSGTYVAGALGAALAMVALHWIVRGRTVAISRDTVALTDRSLLGRHFWREPLANYREIRVGGEQRPHRYGALSWYVVRLCHPEPGKTIELARAKDPALIEQRAHAYARRLALPLSWDRAAPTAPHDLGRGREIAAASGAGEPLGLGRTRGADQAAHAP